MALVPDLKYLKLERWDCMSIKIELDKMWFLYDLILEESLELNGINWPSWYNDPGSLLD